MRSTRVLIAATVLIAASSCGGDDDAAAPAPDAGGDPAQAVEEARDSGDEVADVAAQFESSGDSFARVTVGGETHEFSRVSACVGLGGGVGGGFISDSFSDEFRFDLPPLDWEAQNQAGQEWTPPTVKLIIGPDQFTGIAEDWMPEDVQAVSSVTSWKVDGKSASGSAEVIDLISPDPATVQTMEFEFRC